MHDTEFARSFFTYTRITGLTRGFLCRECLEFGRAWIHTPERSLKGLQRPMDSEILIMQRLIVTNEGYNIDLRLPACSSPMV